MTSFKKKISDDKDVISKLTVTLNEKERLNKEYSDHLLFQAECRPSKHNDFLNKITSVVNSVQPSKEYLLKTFKDSDEYTKEYVSKVKELEQQGNFKGAVSTRFGSNPAHQNTFINYQCKEDAGMFISEIDRFNLQSRNSSQTIYIDKLKGMSMDNNKLGLLRKITQRVMKRNELKDRVHGEQNQAALQKRIERRYRYEDVK